MKAQPFSLKVGHITTRVVPMYEARRKALNCEGYYNPEDPEIGVRIKTSPAEQVRILMHEIIHCCFDAGGWKEIPLTEEIVCDLLDRALTQVFMDNLHLLGVLALALGPTAQGIFEQRPPSTEPQSEPPHDAAHQ